MKVPHITIYIDYEENFPRKLMECFNLIKFKFPSLIYSILLYVMIIIVLFPYGYHFSYPKVACLSFSINIQQQFCCF